MKHTYVLIIYILFLNIGNGQNNQLQLAFKKTELSPADSLVQLPLKEMNSNQQTDSIRTSLLKKGYLNLLINKRQKINDSLQQLEIVLNRRYSHVQIKEDTDLRLEVLKVISLSRKRNFIPINEIENYLYDLNNSIQQEGFPFTTTQLTHFKFNNSDTIEAALTVSQRKKRYLNRITIKGYDKFPTNTLQNFTKRRNTYNDKTIGRLEKSLENMPFVKKTKDTEVLFKQDSTNVFIYLEKIKTNSADGLIGFNNSNNGKLELNGYVHLKLQNNLDRAETFLLEYRNDNGDQTQFTTSIDLPYVWDTPLGISSMLEIQRRDSTYQRTSVRAGLFYKPNWNSTIGINYINSTSTATGQDASLEDFSKNGIELKADIRPFNARKPLVNYPYRVQ